METDEIEIDVFAMMGGMELRIPKHWRLNVQATPFMGGVEDRTFYSQSENSDQVMSHTGKRLTIKGTIIMGGLEVRN